MAFNHLNVYIFFYLCKWKAVGENPTPLLNILTDGGKKNQFHEKDLGLLHFSSPVRFTMEIMAGH